MLILSPSYNFFATVLHSSLLSASYQSSPWF